MGPNNLVMVGVVKPGFEIRVVAKNVEKPVFLEIEERAGFGDHAISLLGAVTDDESGVVSKMDVGEGRAKTDVKVGALVGNDRFESERKRH
jgi:hypothetical protein